MMQILKTRNSTFIFAPGEGQRPLSIFQDKDSKYYLRLTQIPSSHVDLSKNMATKGRGYFALYGLIENLKNLLFLKCLADFQIIL